MSFDNLLGRPLSTHIGAPETSRTPWIEHTLQPPHSDPYSLSSRGAVPEAKSSGANQDKSLAVDRSSQLPSLGDHRYQPDESYREAGPAILPSSGREPRSSAFAPPIIGADGPGKSQSLPERPYLPPPAPYPTQSTQDLQPDHPVVTNPTRQSSKSPPSSDITARDPSSHDAHSKRKERHEELDDPSERQFKKAGVVRPPPQA